MNNIWIVTRVYNNDSFEPRKFATEAEARAEVAYDKMYRWGCAVFLNEECVQTGYLGMERCIEIGKQLSETMNKGVALATGDWIIFMNAGDVFHCSTTLADLICLAPEDPDVIYGDVSIMYRNFVRVQKAMPLSTSWMGIPFSHQSMLTRTRLLRAHKFDIGLRYCADYELVCFLLAAKLRFFYSNQTVSRVSAYGFCDTNRVAVLTEMSHIAKLYFPGILTLLHFTSMVIKEKALGLLKYLIPRKLLELATKIKHWNGNNVLRDWKSLNE